MEEKNQKISVVQGDEIGDILEQQAPPLMLPKFIESKSFRFVAAIVSVLGLSMLPMLILWSNNAGGLNVEEGLIPVLISLLIGVIVFTLTWFISRKNAPVTAFIGSIISFFILDFGLFNSIARKILPFLPHPIGALLIGIIICGIAVFVVLKLKGSKALTIAMTVFSLVIVILFVFNAIKILRPAISRSIAANKYSGIQSPAEVPLKTDIKTDKKHPNIYHIVMDECADFYAMEKYYGIPVEENPFYQFLKSRNFNVAQESYSKTNLSVYSATNIMCLRYVANDAMKQAALDAEETGTPLTLGMTGENARLQFYFGEWFYALRYLGYSSFSVSSHVSHYLQLKELTEPSTMESLLCSVTDEGATVMDVFIDNSILSIFSNGQITSFDRFAADIFNRRLERVSQFFADPSNYTYETPMAIHCYLLPPHTPFFCDAEGNTISSKYRCNWVDTKYYRDQYLYITAVYLSDILDNIIKNDPDAIIFVQSDHGIRGGLYTTESYEIELPDQQRILSALYYGGQELDIEGLSNVNVSRLVLSKLGLYYPQLQDDDIDPIYKQTLPE